MKRRSVTSPIKYQNMFEAFINNTEWDWHMNRHNRKKFLNTEIDPSALGNLVNDKNGIC